MLEKQHILITLKKNANNKSKQYLIYFQKTYKTKATINSMNNVLWYLVAGTRGGYTRARIINSIREKPANANQLAKSLHLDYKTIQHHLNILVENSVLAVIKRGSYGAVYFLSHQIEADIKSFDEIWERIGNKPGKT